MDGTLVDSVAGVIGAWETFAKTYPELDVETILHSNYPISQPNHTAIQNRSFPGSHGVRTADNLAKWCGITDPELLKVSRLSIRMYSRLSNRDCSIRMKLNGSSELSSSLQRMASRCSLACARSSTM